MNPAPIDEVSAVAGLQVVVDVDDGRVTEARGVTDQDVLEVLTHFTETLTGMSAAMLPVLDEFMAQRWMPPGWWSCAGGDVVALYRGQRYVVVDSERAPEFLCAVAGDGLVDGVAVWK